MEFEKETTDNLFVDLTVLRKITNSNETFMKKIIQLFLEDMPIQLSRLEQSLQENNFESISKIAHRVKPSIDHLANDYMQSLVRKIEGKRGKLSNNISFYTIDFCQKSHLLLEQLKEEL